MLTARIQPMDITEIRRLNARYWCDTLGRGKLAEKLGYKDTVYLNQIYIGSTNIGSKNARKFDERLELDMGWMDAPHPDLWGLDHSQLELAQKYEAIYALIRKLSPEGLDYLHARTKRLVEQDALPEDNQ